MTLITISIILATLIFIAYNVASLIIFNIPRSLSDTFYLYKEKWNRGFVFSVMLYFVVTLLLPSWLTLSEGSNFQFLAFLAPASILFVATAPAFMSKSIESVVHKVAAILAAICSLLWIILVTPYWWIILIWLVLFIVAAILTKSYKNSYIYWLELVAFLATFTTTIIYSLV